jgi:AcrR family transcriptional regulator
MARRADHTKEELTELVLRAGEELIEKEGFSAFGARRVAGDIGYTVGTIYHLFGSYDALVLQINARTLDQWYKQLAKAVKDKDSAAAIKALAKSYIRFSQEHQQRWLTLFEHHVPEENQPESYREKFSRFFDLLEEMVLPLLGNKKKQAQQQARVLWAGIHGICILSARKKLASTGSDTADSLAMVFLDTYLKGLA